MPSMDGMDSRPAGDAAGHPDASAAAADAVAVEALHGTVPAVLHAVADVAAKHHHKGKHKAPGTTCSGLS